jgi:hypothetical protein
MVVIQLLTTNPAHLSAKFLLPKSEDWSIVKAILREMSMLVSSRNGSMDIEEMVKIEYEIKNDGCLLFLFRNYKESC